MHVCQYVCVCLPSAWALKYLLLQTVMDNQPAALHPSTCLRHKPEWVVYHEFTLTTKQFIRTVTSVQGEYRLVRMCTVCLSGHMLDIVFPPSFSSHFSTRALIMYGHMVHQASMKYVKCLEVFVRLAGGWLLDLAPHYYDLKNFPHSCAKQALQKIVARRQYQGL